MIDGTGVLFVIDETGGLLLPLNTFLTSFSTGSLCAACGEIIDDNSSNLERS